MTRLMEHVRALEHSSQNDPRGGSAAVMGQLLQAAKQTLAASVGILHRHNIVLFRMRGLVVDVAQRSWKDSNASYLGVAETANIVTQCLLDMDATCVHAFGVNCHMHDLLVEAQENLARRLSIA